MINRHFFELLKALKEASYQSESFNLFSVLRSECDEVRLHSRFIKALLDSSEHHGCQTKFLAAFLSKLGINAFSTNQVTVYNEYQNIDILIKNNDKQVIILENKIYASDQPKQLSRYYEAMKQEGYADKNIWVLYLTLEGREPEPQSCKGIPKAIRKGSNFITIDYKYTIQSWLKECLKISALIPPVRESIAQYKTLIAKLTGSNQGEAYMDKLKTLLLQDDNMNYFSDIEEAYYSNLIDLQLLLWQDIHSCIEQEYPEVGMYQPDSLLISDGDQQLEALTKYYRQKKTQYLGLYYALPNSPAEAAIELEHGMTVGIRCPKHENPREYERLLKQLNSDGKEHHNDHWPIWKFTEDDFNFKLPSSEAIQILKTKSTRQELARAIAAQFYQIWCSAIKE